MNPIDTPPGDHHLTWLSPPLFDHADGESEEVWAGGHLTDVGISILIDRELGSAEQSQATEHVASCQRCSERSSLFSWVDTRVQLIEPAPVFVALPAVVLSAVESTQVDTPPVVVALTNYREKQGTPRTSTSRWRFVVPVAASFVGLGFLGFALSGRGLSTSMLDGQRLDSEVAAADPSDAPAETAPPILEVEPEMAAAETIAAAQSTQLIEESEEAEEADETFAAAAAPESAEVSAAGVEGFAAPAGDSFELSKPSLTPAAEDASAAPESAPASTNVGQSDTKERPGGKTVKKASPTPTPSTLSAGSPVVAAPAVAGAAPAAPSTSSPSAISASSGSQTVVLPQRFDTVDQVVAEMQVLLQAGTIQPQTLTALKLKNLQGCEVNLALRFIAAGLGPEDLVTVVQASILAEDHLVATAPNRTNIALPPMVVAEKLPCPVYD